MKKSRSRCDGFRLPAAFISCAARRYHRVDLSTGCGEASSPGRYELAAVSGLTRAQRVFVKALASVSDRANCSSQSASRSKRQIQPGKFLRSVRSFRDLRRAPAHFSRSGLVNQHVALIRHHMIAAGHRVALNVRLFAWSDGAGGRFSHASR